MDSTIKDEYITACDAVKESVWIKKLITNLQMVLGVDQPLPLHCDNNIVIAQAKEPRSHKKKSKYIERHYHII